MPENAQKWASVERQEDKRDYGTSDAIVDFLNEEQCPVEYHFLSGYHPNWIEEKSREERAALQSPPHAGNGRTLQGFYRLLSGLQRVLAMSRQSRVKHSFHRRSSLQN